jgi:hypothetical protein
LTLQPSQPLLRILNFRNARVSVFPEVEEFLVILDGNLLIMKENKGQLGRVSEGSRIPNLWIRALPEKLIFPW